MKHQLHGICAFKVQKLLDILQRWVGARSDPVTSAGDAGMGCEALLGQQQS